MHVLFYFLRRKQWFFEPNVFFPHRAGRDVARDRFPLHFHRARLAFSARPPRPVLPKKRRIADFAVRPVVRVPQRRHDLAARQSLARRDEIVDVRRGQRISRRQPRLDDAAACGGDGQPDREHVREAALERVVELVRAVRRGEHKDVRGLARQTLQERVLDAALEPVVLARARGHQRVHLVDEDDRGRDRRRARERGENLLLAVAHELLHDLADVDGNERDLEALRERRDDLRLARARRAVEERGGDKRGEAAAQRHREPRDKRPLHVVDAGEVVPRQRVRDRLHVLGAAGGDVDELRLHERGLVLVGLALVAEDGDGAADVLVVLLVLALCALGPRERLKVAGGADSIVVHKVISFAGTLPSLNRFVFYANLFKHILNNNKTCAVGR